MDGFEYQALRNVIKKEEKTSLKTSRRSIENQKFKKTGRELQRQCILKRRKRRCIWDQRAKLERDIDKTLIREVRPMDSEIDQGHYLEDQNMMDMFLKGGDMVCIITEVVLISLVPEVVLIRL